MAEGDTDEAHAQNRRVEFIITKQSEQKPAVKYVPVAPKSDAEALRKLSLRATTRKNQRLTRLSRRRLTDKAKEG